MKIENKREEIVKKLRKLIKNSNVFYETFFDGLHYTTTFHIIMFCKLSMYTRIDDEIILKSETSVILKHIIQAFEYNMYSEIFNTKEYNKLYMEGR